MKIVNVNAGQETGGALTHLIFLSKILKSHQITNELLLFEDGTVAKAARREHLDFKIIPQKEVKTWVSWLNQKRFDFVQTHGPRANFLVTLHRKEINSSHIVTVHSDPQFDFMGQGLKGLLETRLNYWSLKKADGLFVVSKEIKEKLINLGISSKKLIQLNNAIEFSTKIPAKIEHQFMQVIMVARLHPVKGHKRLLDALVAVNNPQIKLHLVGDGPIRRELETKVATENLVQQVKFYGALNSEEINELYRKMDLALIVSKSEGFPLVFLEAANNAVPTLMTNLSATSMLIPDENYGIRVNNNLDGIITGLQQAFAMGPEKLQEIGQNSRDYAKEQFGPAAFFNQIKKGYELFSNSSIV